MALDLYVETSVFGALFDVEPPGWAEKTREFLDGLAAGTHRAHISQTVLVEIGRAPERIRRPLLEEVRKVNAVLHRLDAETLGLAEAYLAAGAVPVEYANDAIHVAVASVRRLDAVVSWNHEHMVNLSARRKIHLVNLERGYRLVDVITPWEVPDVGS